MARWRVVHRFSTGIDVKNPVTAYPDVGILLFYEGNKLERIEHEFDTDDAVEANQVVNASHERLKLFWELLQFRRGLPLPAISSTAQELQTDGMSRPIGRGYADVAARVSICLLVVLPDPQFFSRRNSRLPVWLNLANDAATSANAIHSIRNYYMVWEDLHPAWKIQNGPTEATELKLIRDFVSHGKELRNRDVLKFIRSKLGKPIRQFDPTDLAQQQFLTLQNGAARKLIEKELDSFL